MEWKTITIGVPAHNEASVIQKTVDRLRSLETPEGASLEILVCANACSDATHSIVRKIAANDARVKLIVERKRGKANAMNRIMHEANGGAIFYCDADTFVPKNALLHLLPELEKPGIHAATGVPFFLHRPFRTLAEIMASASAKTVAWNKLVGAFFAIKKQHLQEIGGFPENVISEDVWYSRKYPERYSINPQLKIEMAPPTTINDLVKQRIRWMEGDAQLRQIGLPSTTRENSKVNYFVNRLAGLKNLSLSERVLFFPIFPIKAYARWAGARAFARRTKTGWESPKRPT